MKSILKKFLTSKGLPEDKAESVATVLSKHDLKNLNENNINEFISKVFSELNFTDAQKAEAEKMMQAMIQSKK